MILIMLGAPGAGKGTQGAEVVRQYKIPNISTGDLLREEVKNGTDLGSSAKEYMNAGKLVPDAVIISMLEARIQQDDCTRGFILDGFPRNIAQAEALNAIFDKHNKKLSKVVNVHVDDDAIVERLSNRLTCSICKEGFNRVSKPPQKEGVCDKCGGELFQRDDDKEVTIRNRLEVYHSQTKPLIDHYSKEGLLFQVDGNRPVEKIWPDINEALKNIGE